MKNVSVCVLAFAILTQSCATILNGTKAEVYVSDGSPSKAKVYYNDNYMGTTPLEIEVRRKEKRQTIEIKKEGYEPISVRLKREVMIGYIIYYALLLDVISAAIDFGGGAVYKVEPEEIKYDLEKQKIQAKD